MEEIMIEDNEVNSDVQNEIKHFSNEWDKCGYDMDRMDELEKEASPSIAEARDKDIIMLIGKAGTGKSSLTNYLSGCVLGAEEGPTGIKVKIIEQPLWLKRTAKIGEDVESQTAYPEIFTNIYSGKTYGDFPGFEGHRTDKETRAFESISTHVVINACNSIPAIIVVISKDSIGDRCEGLIVISKILGEYLQDVQAAQQSILFVFTKYDCERFTGDEINHDILVQIKKTKSFLHKQIENSSKDLKQRQDAVKTETTKNRFSKFISNILWSSKPEPEMFHDLRKEIKENMLTLKVLKLINNENMMPVNIFDGGECRKEIEKKLDSVISNNSIAKEAINSRTFDSERNRFDISFLARCQICLSVIEDWLNSSTIIKKNTLAIKGQNKQIARDKKTLEKAKSIKKKNIITLEEKQKLIEYLQSSLEVERENHVQYCEEIDDIKEKIKSFKKVLTEKNTSDHVKIKKPYDIDQDLPWSEIYELWLEEPVHISTGKVPISKCVEECPDGEFIIRSDKHDLKKGEYHKVYVGGWFKDAKGRVALYAHKCDIPKNKADIVYAFKQIKLLKQELKVCQDDKNDCEENIKDLEQQIAAEKNNTPEEVLKNITKRINTIEYNIKRKEGKIRSYKEANKAAKFKIDVARGKLRKYRNRFIQLKKLVKLFDYKSDVTKNFVAKYGEVTKYIPNVNVDNGHQSREKIKEKPELKLSRKKTKSKLPSYDNMGVSDLKSLSRKGQTIAHYYLAEYYRLHADKKESRKTAEKYYKKAFLIFKKRSYEPEKCSAEIFFYLGLCYEMGRGTLKDENKALSCYQEATNREHARACYRLAKCYDRARGTARNAATADKYYKKSYQLLSNAIHQDRAEIYFYLALCHKRGKGTTINKKQAGFYFTKADNKGYFPARKQLAKLTSGAMHNESDIDRWRVYSRGELKTHAKWYQTFSEGDFDYAYVRNLRVDSLDFSKKKP